jgi:hypothetical protein
MELKNYLFPKAKKLSTQNSLAKIVAMLWKEPRQVEVFIKDFILQYLVKDSRPEDEYILKTLLIIVSKFCEIQDEYFKKRVRSC